VLTALGLIAARDSSPDWGLLFEGPGQLVALAVGGIFTMGIEAMGITVNVSVVWLPLFVTAVIVAGLIFLSIRDEKAQPSASRGARWVRSAITGFALSLLILLVSAILPIRYNLGGDGTNPFTAMLSGGGTGSAASFTAFLGALILATAVGYFSRARVSVSRTAKAITPIRHALTTVWRMIALYVGVVSALLAIGLIVYFAVQGADALLTIFLWLPTLVLMGVGFVNLSPIGLFGGGQALAGLGSNAQTGYWMPADLPIWATALILVINLALIASVGILLALSRMNSRTSTAIRWVITVASFAVTGAVISLLSGIAFRTSLDLGSAGEMLDGVFSGTSSAALESSVSMRATVGLAAWTFIIFAILGALVEAAATYLAPLLIPLLPAMLRARLTRATFVAAPATAAGTAAAAPGAAAATPSGPAYAPAPGAPAATAYLTGDGSTADASAPADGSSPEWASASSAPADALPVVEPMTPERKKKVVIVLASIGAAIVLVVGASIALSIVNSTVYSPANQVESYLDDLIDGNGTAAFEAGNLGVDGSSHVLLTDEVLGATDGRITDYSITDTSVSGDNAMVTVDVEQGGQTESVYYNVVRSGKTLVVFDNWGLDSVSLQTISMSVPEGVTELLVNDVAISIDDADADLGYIDLAAFPGEYTVQVGGTNEFLSSEPATVTVPAGMGILDFIDLELAPTEAFHNAVSAQIDDYVESCAAQGVLDADDCPIYTYAYGTITDVVWTITQPATFTIEDYGNGEWYVSGDDYGTATVSYTRSTAFTPAESQTEETEFSVRGMVKMVDGAPVYTYDY